MYVSVHQTLRAMQLSALLLTACCLTVSAGTLSQSSITYSGKDVKLEAVFEAVKKQTGYYFVYNKDVVNNAPKITVNVKNIPLEEFMQIILKDQNLEWVLQKTTILIQKKKEEPTQESEQEQKPYPVTGIVRGPDGAPLAGINITIKGTKRGTITDNEGKFRINADDGNVLEISAIGFTQKELKINGQKQIVVELEIATSVLDEVQYIAYGQTSKRLNTGNTATVKAADIEKQPVQNPLLALQGRVPGLVVTQPSGISGSAIKVRIQGQNSIANGNDPLYVVDGVPIDAKLQATGADGILATDGIGFSGNGDPLSYLNPSDIESIDVLKDADATAIYGSRAANGAILITTKKGKAGVMQFDVNMQTGWGKMTRRLDMMNTRQYLDMRYEAFKNDHIDWRSPSVVANDLKVWDTTSYTNWQDELLGGSAQFTNINSSISGGSSTMRYLVSGTYQKQSTVFPFPEFKDRKASVHFNLNANNNSQKLKMQFSGNYMFDDNRLPQIDITRSAILMEPNAPPLLNADGSINWAPDASGNTTLGGSDINVMITRLSKYVNKTRNLVSGLKLDYSMMPGLNVGASLGYNHMQTNDHITSPLSAVAPEQRATSQRSAAFGDRTIQTWIMEPQATYRHKIAAGVVHFLIGSTFQEKSATSNFLNGLGQLSDELLDDINAAATIAPRPGTATAYRYNAIFSRINYNWRDRYIINLNVRRDGSTRFGGDNRFQNFGSVAGAWIFSDEKFFDRYQGVVSFGKLKGSYGVTGSDQIGDYQFLSLYNLDAPSVPYQGIAGLSPTGLPNPALQWEQTRKLQIGIDVGFFRDRLVINATFARNRSSNQLLSYALPTQTGFTAYLVNFPATVQNKSWEFLITAKMVDRKKVAWISNINLTIPRNKLVAFPDLENSTYATRLRIGHPLDVGGGWYHWLGVAPGTGEYLFADKKGNPTITPKSGDNTVLISRFPKFFGGWENTLSFNGIEFSFICQFSKQISLNDLAISNGFFQFPGMFAAGASNQPVTHLDRWQKPGDTDKSIAKYSTAATLHVTASDRRWADVSYVRLKNISLSWDLPEEWVAKARLRSFRLYIHGQNLLTFTNYKGLDPETQSLYLPPLQVYTIGLKLGL